MTTITKNELGNYVVSGEFDISASFSVDEDAKKSGESTKVTLRYKMTEVPLASIIASSLKDKRINEQIKLRKHPELYKEGQVIVVNYTGGSLIDAEAQWMAKFEAMSREEKLAEIEKLKKKMAG